MLLTGRALSQTKEAIREYAEDLYDDVFNELDSMDEQLDALAMSSDAAADVAHEVKMAFIRAASKALGAHPSKGSR